MKFKRFVFVLSFVLVSCGVEKEKQLIVVNQPATEEPATEQGDAASCPQVVDGGPVLPDGGTGVSDRGSEDARLFPPPGCGSSGCPVLKIFTCGPDGRTPLICGPRMGEPEDCASVWQDIGFMCPPGTSCVVVDGGRTFDCTGEEVRGVAPVCTRCGTNSDCPPEAPYCLVWTTNTAISWCSGPCGSLADCPPNATCFSGPEISSVCIPRWWLECRDGDVWEVDSCGNAIRMIEECGSSSCLDGAC